MKKLEDELGVTLFERGPGKVSVTPAGQKIVEQSQRVLEGASRIRELAAAGAIRWRDAAPGRDLHHRALPAAEADPDPAQERAHDELLIQENFTLASPRAEEPRGRRDPDRAAVREPGS